MSVFQVTSINSQLASPPKKRARRLPYQGYILLRALSGGIIGGLLFTLLLNIFGHPDSFFIFLPVSVSLAWAQPMCYNIGKFLTSAPVYLLLTMCWTFIYYAVLVESQVLIYQDPSIAHIIPIASAISWVIIFDPARAFVQQHIERRFNVRDKEAAKAIEAFAATLRERFLAVIQQTMHPYSISLWTRASHAQQVQFSSPEEIEVADNDALIPYVLHRPVALEVDRLRCGLRSWCENKRNRHANVSSRNGYASRNASNKNYRQRGLSSAPFYRQKYPPCQDGSSHHTTNLLARSAAISTISCHVRRGDWVSLLEM
jgi:hypothetical protein